MHAVLVVSTDLDLLKLIFQSGLLWDLRWSSNNYKTLNIIDVRLVNALAATYSKRINRQIDPLKEIVVTVGATEALFVAMQAIVKPGDEVILIEPFYDSYPHCVVSIATSAQSQMSKSLDLHVHATHTPYHQY